MNNKIRALAIALLDDEHGINDNSNQLLNELLMDTGNVDICDATKIVQNRAFLEEDDAQTLREKVS